MTGGRFITRLVGLASLVVSCGAATAQTLGSAAPVVTEARRREILQAAAALTSETLVDVLRRAEAGDVEAQVLAGIALHDGTGAPKDVDEALRWTRLAAEKNHPIGQNMLGNAYARGEGAPQDLQKAAEWYTKAAALGYATAQNNLGLAYFDGRGVQTNPAEAVRLFRLAAEQGNPGGQVSLAYAYRVGKGIKKDEREAVEWSLKAAEQGDPEGQHNLAVAYLNGQGVRKDKAEAEKWFRKSSDQGFAVASFLYGLINFEKAPPGSTDLISALEGVKSWKLSAKQGYPVAAFALGELNTGRMFRYHVAGDDLEACRWYTIASNLDTQDDWARAQPEAVAAMRRDLPGRINKVRKSLKAAQYAECQRQAAYWMKAQQGSGVGETVLPQEPVPSTAPAPHPQERFLGLDLFGGGAQLQNELAPATDTEKATYPHWGWDAGATVSYGVPWLGISAAFGHQAVAEDWGAYHLLAGPRVTSPWLINDNVGLRAFAHALAGFARTSGAAPSQSSAEWVVGGGVDILLFRVQVDYVHLNLNDVKGGFARVFLGGVVPLCLRACGESDKSALPTTK